MSMGGTDQRPVPLHTPGEWGGSGERVGRGLGREWGEGGEGVGEGRREGGGEGREGGREGGGEWRREKKGG